MAKVMVRVIWVLLVLIAASILLLIGFGAGTMFGVSRALPGLRTDFDVPREDQAQAAKVILPAAGTEVTIKQRKSAWLPGGEYCLYLDDITGGQVLVSVADRHGHVVWGPSSVRNGDVLQLPTQQRPKLRVKVIRLVNLLMGEDFGVFLVTQ